MSHLQRTLSYLNNNDNLLGKNVIQLAQLTGNPGWKISEVGEETILPSIDFK